ncbi:MAG TPA: UdgX family uracil-DNA binding protein [Acidimicrobiia bacterium]|nr:UdgX family uracil-DNA binding protein [Acidimicrobiia bacterium]
MADTVVKRRQALEELADVAKSCTNCPLFKDATQTVFGIGPITAKLVLVGEQPGDEEDKQGEPFVGPAGKLLRSALVEVEIDPDDVYMTNVVKHFKWKPGAGWRRLHQKPNRYEIEACRPWLEGEFHLLRPRLVVGLGATACQAMLGSSIKVLADRGKVFDWGERQVLVTVHPSSILRSRDEASRRENRQAFVADLREAARLVRV